MAMRASRDREARRDLAVKVRTPIAVVVLAVALGGFVISLASLSTAGIVDPEPDVIRAVHVYGSNPASSHCQGDSCTVELPDKVELDLPAIGDVDVTVSLGLTYRTSSGDTLRST
jgi:flavin reductase (DIM6/NTAB) family NADH-FMN oxidoreductase RutF